MAKESAKVETKPWSVRHMPVPLRQSMKVQAAKENKSQEALAIELMAEGMERRKAGN